MTALYLIATPVDGVDGSTFAVVANEHTADYVYYGDPVEDLDASRVQDVAASLDAKPTTPELWLAAACYNMSYVSFSDPVEAEDLVTARQDAYDQLATLAAESAWRIPQTREEKVLFQQRALDEWARKYPAVAAGEDDDPEAELALMHLMTPPVDPQKPHKWLPIATTETDCGFCEQPQDAAIHKVDADTITRGSE